MINYENLVSMYQNTNPYKGTEDIPYDKRSHRHKFFNAVMVNGKLEFHISYYWKWKEEIMDLTDYEIIEPYLTKFKKERWSLINMDYHEYKIPYMRKWVRQSEPFCIVRDDNTMEFTTDDFHQGLRMIISDHMRRGYYIMKEKASGGVIIRSSFRSDSKLKMPVFKGLRVNIDTLEPHESTRYRLEHRMVDRKKLNSIMKEHEDRTRLVKAFYNTMDIKDLGEGIIEVNDEYFGGEYGWRDSDKAREHAVAIWDIDPVKSSYLYLLGYSILDARWLGRHTSQYKPMDYYKHLKRAIRHNITVENDAFIKASYWDFDKTYPTSKWGITIMNVSDGRVYRQAQ